jgi:hypothetical protein
MPRSGWCQRSSASKPEMTPVSSVTRLIIDFCSGMVYTATVIILGPEGVPYD